MKYLFTFITIGLMMVLLYSCGGGSEKSTQKTVAPKPAAEIPEAEKKHDTVSVEPAEVKPDSATKAGQAQTVRTPTAGAENAKPETAKPETAVHVPTGKRPPAGWPLIIFLDPHADGNLPVSLYGDLADEYGFLLIGSNRIKNGMQGQKIVGAFNKLFTEALTKYKVDKRRIYMMGFSGGARVALAFAEAYPDIKAVVACGAGIQPGVKPPPSTFSYLGMAGNEDFNMIEVINTDRILNREKFEHAIIIFDGDHNWPPEPVAVEAFRWLDLIAMKKNDMPRNAVEIAEAKTWYINRINELKEQGRIFDSYEVAERAGMILDGLTDVKAINTLADQLRKNPEYNNQMRDMVQTMQKEMGLQNTLLQAFGEKDVKWWMAEINNLNSSKGTRSEQLMNKRLMAYLGIMAYMMSTKMINEKNIDAAEKSLSIYRLVEPTNSEHVYLEAKRRMLMNEPAKALDYLRLAKALGFNDFERLSNDPAFASLHNDPAFKQLLQQPLGK
jgi:hypothetical protein